MLHFPMKKISARYLFAISMLAISLPLHAEDSNSAEITALLGQVEVRLDAKSPRKKAEVGQKISEEAVVTTVGKSVATVTMPDQSIIKIGSNSVVTIKELSNSQKKNSSTVIALLSGSLFSKVQKQKGNLKFRVITKTASMGVRGTQFFTALSEKKAGKTDVWMCVHEGEVLVKGRDSKSVTVKAGEGVVVPAGKSVTEPKPYAWTQKLNWNMDPKAGELIDNTSLDSAYHDLLDQNYD